ncbi:MAG: type III-B CRISPR module-associated Cmr3 family protein [bacterium]
MSESKNIYHYLADPFDVLYFRNNKAFDFGEWYSEGIFPPLPSTFQGFVRTSMLLRNGWLNKGHVDWEKAKSIIGDDNDFPFEIIGPYLFASESHCHFLSPRDIILEDSDVKRARQIKLSPSPVKTDLAALYYPQEKEKADYLCYDGGVISTNDLTEYRRFGSFCYHNKSLSQIEEHYGIQLQENKSVEEHRFYLTPYQRLSQNVSLYFQIRHSEELKDLSNQTGRLGSEGRGAVIQATDHALNLKLDDSFYKDLAKDKKFKLILLQPSIFKENWLPFPKCENEGDAWVLEYEGLKLKLLYAQTDTSLKISGMNFKDKQSNSNGETRYGLKPMVNAVPAGSVYYFEILNDSNTNDLHEILRNLDDSKIPCGSYSNMGYNHVVIGKIV